MSDGDPARAAAWRPAGRAAGAGLRAASGHRAGHAAAYERAGFAWPTDPQGYHLGYGFLKLPPRDLAKLGYLYLNGGTWEGRQVVPAVKD